MFRTRSEILACLSNRPRPSSLAAVAAVPPSHALYQVRFDHSCVASVSRCLSVFPGNPVHSSDSFFERTLLHGLLLFLSRVGRCVAPKPMIRRSRVETPVFCCCFVEGASGSPSPEKPSSGLLPATTPITPGLIGNRGVGLGGRRSSDAQPQRRIHSRAGISEPAGLGCAAPG